MKRLCAVCGVLIVCGFLGCASGGSWDAVRKDLSGDNQKMSTDWPKQKASAMRSIPAPSEDSSR